MGQGQEFHARKMINDGMTAGGWVMLQNVHLSLSFCSEIIDILVETEHIEETFRLWVTTEVHDEFPIGLLQMAIKFTNEPPQGIRASMKRSYQVIISEKNLLNSQNIITIIFFFVFLIIGIFTRLFRLYRCCTMATIIIYSCIFAYGCTRTSKIWSTWLECSV